MPQNAEEIEEGGDAEQGEGRPLKREGLPEDIGIAEGLEPEQVDRVGDSCAAAEGQYYENGKDKEKIAAARAPGTGWTRPLDGFGQWIPLRVG